MQAAAVGAAAQAQTARVDNKFDQEIFMKILVAQLRYQNPMNPQQDSQQMISQITQFSMLEQLTNLSQQLESLVSSGMAGTLGSMLGKEVTYLDAEGETIAGTAEAVVFRNGQPYLVVEGVEVAPADLISFYLKEE